MMRLVMRPFVVFSLISLIYALWVVFQQQNPLMLATLGERYTPAELQPFTYSEEGYDGQFAYLLARYGWESTPYVDVPAYRAQRVLLPFLGRTLALAQPEAVLWALLAVNVLAVGLGVYALERLLVQAGASQWLTVGYALSIGVFGSVRLTTTEALAYGLVLAGLLAITRQRLLLGALLLGISALAKEMTLVFPFAWGLYLLSQRQWKHAIGYGALSLVPFVLWQGVLWAQYGQLGIGSGGEGATSFEFIPFMGYLRIWTEGSLAAFLLLTPFIVGFAIFPAVWGLVRVWQDKKATLPAFVLVVNALLMAFVPFSTYREILGILRFVAGLQIAVIWYAATTRRHKALMYSTLWLFTSLLLLFSDASPAP